ncbi:hypothetical protein [Myxococcus qinghaiensis]|uniref:hypothetical protein n=1 Tax=Myxococcus qinghaiensis TaxID=2906758 RepID=UPI0020A79731|nr:hypothetical protein [Myxococcus qinghaiensis]MCP3166665.1 hypothetical protein [Myxococcus qinghaiensis]
MSVGGSSGAGGSNGANSASNSASNAASKAADAASKAASSISNALGGLGKALGGLGGLAKGIGDALGKVSEALGKVSGLLDKGLSAITGPLKDIVGKALDNLPFGIGQLAKPFADKFIDNGLSMVAGGPLAGVSSMLGQAQNVGKLADTVETVRNAATVAGDIAQGKFNAQQLAAFAQSQLMRGQ